MPINLDLEAPGGTVGWMEQRKQQRVVSSLKVTYQVLDPTGSDEVLRRVEYRHSLSEHFAELAQDSRVFLAVTRDLSSAGLGLVTFEKLEVGAWLSLRMSLPGYNAPASLLAKVMNVREGRRSGENSWEAGLEIRAIHRGDILRIELHLARKRLKKAV